MKRIMLALAVAVLAGCVSQSEMALSNNVYKLDIDASGLIGTSIAKGQAQRRVAQLTLDKGFTHYLIQAADTQNSRTYAGNMPVYANTNVDIVGNTAYGNTTYTGGQAIYRRQSQTSIVVAMFRSPNIPGNAIDAAAVLKSSR
ncbi:hypothetical protein [Rhizobium ruizarguesonis]|nr:hypothetical protein [Rhizobium ruizarguesonis]